MNHKITDYFSKAMNTQIKESQPLSNLLSLPHQNFSLWEYQSKILKTFTSGSISENEFFGNFEKLVYYGRKHNFNGLPGLETYLSNLQLEHRKKFMAEILPFMALKALNVKYISLKIICF